VVYTVSCSQAVTPKPAAKTKITRKFLWIIFGILK
jgi:hypothetical protein